MEDLGCYSFATSKFEFEVGKAVFEVRRSTFEVVGISEIEHELKTSN
jgi:hypothetical protein